MFYIEHTSEYSSNKRASLCEKGMDMTVLDDRQLMDWYLDCAERECAPVRRRRAVVSHHPGPERPRVAPVRYPRSGIAVSQAVHARNAPRPVSAKVTVALAVLAALITLWLGSLATFSGDRAAAPVPDQLAVVQVQAGESLQHLAGRVAPDAPVGQVVDRIRDLNDLESAAIEAGQTLIAPIG